MPQVPNPCLYISNSPPTQFSSIAFSIHPISFLSFNNTSKNIQEMKSIFFSLFLVLALVYCFAHSSNAAIPCGTVTMKAASCITFATGKDSNPSKPCCDGLRQLVQTVKTVDDKKDICRCLKAAVKNIGGVQDKFLSKIPAACSIKVGFPVSINTDCEKLH